MGLVEDVSELAEILRAQDPPVSRVGRKNKPSVHSYTLYCTVLTLAKQPMAEELNASDWMHAWCNFSGLVATKKAKRKASEYRNGWKNQDKTSAKDTHSSSKKENPPGKRRGLLLHSGSEACTHDSV